MDNLLHIAKCRCLEAFSQRKLNFHSFKYVFKMLSLTIKSWQTLNIIVCCLFTGSSPYLRVNLEVSLLNKLVVARVLAWGSGLASWDGVGEPGGAWEGGLRSRICPPWNVLLTVVPLDRREDGVEDEEEAPEAPAMLCVEGEAGGRRWDKELEWREVKEEKR